MENEMKNLSEAEKAAMRVAVAKDVIKHLASQKIKAAGCYVDLPEYVKANADFRPILQKFTEPCRVCGVGALFIAHVLRFNEVKTKSEMKFQFGDYKVCTEPLVAYFSKEQLFSIEGAYEGQRIGEGECATDSEKEFYNAFDSNRQRLTAICKNIIKHNGEFRPELEFEVSSGK